jgi:hypothetical protein
MICMTRECIRPWSSPCARKHHLISLSKKRKATIRRRRRVAFLESLELLSRQLRLRHRESHDDKNADLHGDRHYGAQ